MIWILRKGNILRLSTDRYIVINQILRIFNDLHTREYPYYINTFSVLSTTKNLFFYYK